MGETSEILCQRELVFEPATLLFVAQVKWARQQQIRRRVKRDLLDKRERERSERAGRAAARAPTAGPRMSRSKTPVMFNDPRWLQMWYLVSHRKLFGVAYSGF